MFLVEILFMTMITTCTASGDVVSKCPIYIKFFGEDGVDFGGVQRDMFSAFWKEAYTKFFEGSNLLIPMVNPHIELSVAISHFWPDYLSCLFGCWIFACSHHSAHFD